VQYGQYRGGERPRDHVQQNTFTEVSYTQDGHGGRGRGGQRQTLGGACCGAFVGILLLMGTSVFLWHSEGVAVRSQRSLDDARDALARGTRGLEYVSGHLTADRALSDEPFGIQGVEALRLERKVDVYQWREHTDKQTRKVPDGRGGQLTETTTTQRYDTAWEGRAISSQSFKHPQGHHNPSWPEALDVATSRNGGRPFGGASQTADVRLEGLTLSPDLRSKAERVEPLPLPPATRTLLGGSAVLGEFVYSESACVPPREPRVGCVRLSWSHAPLRYVSVLAERSRAGALRAWTSSAGSGYEVGLLEMGDVSAEAMLQSAASANSVMLWLKRGGGILLVWIGWGLVLGPATYIASYVPLVGSLVGCALGLVAFGCAMAHALTVIAVAWVAHRPLLAGTLLAAVAAIVYMLYGSLRARKATHSKSP